MSVKKISCFRQLSREKCPQVHYSDDNIDEDDKYLLNTYSGPVITPSDTPYMFHRSFSQPPYEAAIISP